jgi:hypothetical protein
MTVALLARNYVTVNAAWALGPCVANCDYTRSAEGWQKFREMPAQSHATVSFFRSSRNATHQKLQLQAVGA